MDLPRSQLDVVDGAVAKGGGMSLTRPMRGGPKTNTEARSAKVVQLAGRSLSSTAARRASSLRLFEDGRSNGPPRPARWIRQGRRHRRGQASIRRRARRKFARRSSGRRADSRLRPSPTASCTAGKIHGAGARRRRRSRGSRTLDSARAAASAVRACRDRHPAHRVAATAADRVLRHRVPPHAAQVESCSR